MKKLIVNAVVIVLFIGVLSTVVIFAMNYNGDESKENVSKVNLHEGQSNISNRIIDKTNKPQDTITNEILISSESNNDNKNDSELKVDSGRYVGRIDNNSIEIKVSGVPEEKSARAFRLSESIKSEFDSYNLNKDDQIKVSYKLDKNNQPVIEKIN